MGGVAAESPCNVSDELGDMPAAFGEVVVLLGDVAVSVEKVVVPLGEVVVLFEKVSELFGVVTRPVAEESGADGEVAGPPDEKPELAREPFVLLEGALKAVGKVFKAGL